MPLYFFDTRDDDDFIRDEEGLELPGLDAAKKLAALSLAELAKDVIPSVSRRELAVEVRDERRLVLKTLMHFEAVVLV